MINYTCPCLKLSGWFVVKIFHGCLHICLVLWSGTTDKVKGLRGLKWGAQYSRQPFLLSSHTRPGACILNIHSCVCQCRHALQPLFKQLINKFSLSLAYTTLRPYSFPEITEICNFQSLPRIYKLLTIETRFTHLLDKSIEVYRVWATLAKFQPPAGPKISYMVGYPSLPAGD